MYRDDYSDELVKILKKLKKKNPKPYEILCKKRDEVLEHPQRYKNLRYDLTGKKRVHIDKHFVLVFSIDEENRVVKFLDYDHHDSIYRRKK
jgi:YafQ family addiction module toxin component